MHFACRLYKAQTHSHIEAPISGAAAWTLRGGNRNRRTITYLIRPIHRRSLTPPHARPTRRERDPLRPPQYSTYPSPPQVGHKLPQDIILSSAEPPRPSNRRSSSIFMAAEPVAVVFDLDACWCAATETPDSTALSVSYLHLLCALCCCVCCARGQLVSRNVHVVGWRCSV